MTTHRPTHNGNVTTPMGPKFVTTTGRSGARSGDHTQLLADRTRVLGPDAPDTLATRNNLAYWLGDAGRMDEQSD